MRSARPASWSCLSAEAGCVESQPPAVEFWPIFWRSVMPARVSKQAAAAISRPDESASSSCALEKARVKSDAAKCTRPSVKKPYVGSIKLITTITAEYNIAAAAVWRCVWSCIRCASSWPRHQANSSSLGSKARTRPSLTKNVRGHSAVTNALGAAPGESSTASRQWPETLAKAPLASSTSCLNTAPSIPKFCCAKASSAWRRRSAASCRAPARTRSSTTWTRRSTCNVAAGAVARASSAQAPLECTRTWPGFRASKTWTVAAPPPAAAAARSSASFLAGSAAYVATPALTPAEKMPAPMNMILAARKGYATYHRDIQ
mmetsp:Transcript_16194/g.54619  ORF Transcript_16194/g.54619 Transcript_16194/m.54619 type:complete len:318 (+) Transcript_16194:131-1084(+)